MPELDFDFPLIDRIASTLDLRDPNTEALRSIAVAVELHARDHGPDEPFEGVVDVATGVGKTYVMAAAIDYFAARGHRHFAVITPGTTILKKTIRNFSPGDEKSLLPGMSIRPELITAEDFDTPRVSSVMDAPDQVKVYVFTVQSLLRPTTNIGRRTHEFREGLGDAFYDKVASEPGLIVFADEHHTYYGDAFSQAVRGLNPYALVGLTATPHPNTPDDQIIFRYPLAAAIADQYVKTPVIVGRRDERTDDETKLADATRLLEFKRQAVERYVSSHGLDSMNAVMLVVAQTIDDADRYAEILQSPDFFKGRYDGAVLTVHSDQSDAALADLERVEDPRSPVRIIVSVGMLKEGWDVKNVYVIASMRASVSEILTEQTLGRGLRLPFGGYTGIEMLDTLEVIAHEQYEALLERADVLREEFVDYRTLIRISEDGQGTPSIETEPVAPPVHVTQGEGKDREDDKPSATEPGGLNITSVEERTADVENQTEKMRESVTRREGLPEVHVPVVRMTEVKATFSLADIDPEVFRELGKRHAANPEDELLRMVVSAEADGDELKLVTRSASDRVEASSREVPLEFSRRTLKQRVGQADEVPARTEELDLLDDLIDAYVDGLGEDAEEILASYPHRAARGFRKALREAQRGLEVKPEFGEITSYEPLPDSRPARSQTSKDLAGRFQKGIGYEGYEKSYFPQVWFDSEPEFSFARVVDNAEEIHFWVRLLRNDLPILWTSGGNRYNPDFLVVTDEEEHIIVEVKDRKAVANEDVQGKKKAAGRWVRRVSAAQGKPWKYWIVTGEDVAESGGSWSALRTLVD